MMRMAKPGESGGIRSIIGLDALHPSDRNIALDLYGMQHNTCSAAALEAFEQATLAVMAHRPDAIDAIDRSLSLEPHMVASLALAGFCYVILARSETVAMARLMYLRAICAAEINGSVTSDEHALLQSLDFAVRGRLRSSANVLDEHLTREAGPLLMIKLCHALRFISGDAGGMLRTTHHVLATSSVDRAGYGFILGMHAFALEETGELADALKVGMEAVQMEHADSWGAHAVAHVFEMTRRPQKGLTWLRRTEEHWRHCNNFAHHLTWHAALFHLELGRHQRALELYDEAIHPGSSEDFRDFANASSLLFRICQDGVDVGDRWVVLSQMAHRRRHQTGLVFARLHDLLSLAVAGDAAACRDLLVSLEDMASEPNGDQAQVAASIGVPLARLIVGFMERTDVHNDRPEGRLDQLARQMARIGGSHAQRDVFVRLLAVEAARRNDLGALGQILDIRRESKQDDRFSGQFRDLLSTRLQIHGLE